MRSQSSTRSSRTRSLIEPCESRRMLAAAPAEGQAAIVDHVIYVNGKSSADDIQISQTSTGVTVAIDGSSFKFKTSDYDSINVAGDSGDDRIDAGGVLAPLVVNAGYGNDYVLGGKGNDVITGGEDNDNLNGGAGKNQLFGNGGNDRLNGSNGPDLLKGEAGEDRIYGNGGDDTVDGGGGRDRVAGGAGNDLLFGGGSNDRLFGEDGNDRLIGSDGADHLDGGAGTDSADNDKNDTRVSIESLS